MLNGTRLVKQRHVRPTAALSDEDLLVRGGDLAAAVIPTVQPGQFSQQFAVFSDHDVPHLCRRAAPQAGASPWLRQGVWVYACRCVLVSRLGEDRHENVTEPATPGDSDVPALGPDRDGKARTGRHPGQTVQRCSLRTPRRGYADR